MYHFFLNLSIFLTIRYFGAYLIATRYCKGIPQSEINWIHWPIKRYICTSIDIAAFHASAKLTACHRAMKVHECDQREGVSAKFVFLIFRTMNWIRVLLTRELIDSFNNVAAARNFQLPRESRVLDSPFPAILIRANKFCILRYSFARADNYSWNISIHDWNSIRHLSTII